MPVAGPRASDVCGPGDERAPRLDGGRVEGVERAAGLTASGAESDERGGDNWVRDVPVGIARGGVEESDPGPMAVGTGRSRPAHHNPPRTAAPTSTIVANTRITLGTTLA